MAFLSKGDETTAENQMFLHPDSDRFDKLTGRLREEFLTKLMTGTDGIPKIKETPFQAMLKVIYKQFLRGDRICRNMSTAIDERGLNCSLFQINAHAFEGVKIPNKIKLCIEDMM